MGVSTLHYALPSEFTEKLRTDDGLAEAFVSVFGCGFSLEKFFLETDSEEIEEVMEEIPPESVEVLKELVAKTKFGSSAYTEKTFDLHIQGIATYLESKGYLDAQELASSMICGDGEIFESDISVTAKAQQEKISNILNGNLDKVFSMYKLDKPYSDSGWKEDIKNELDEIIQCYVSACEINGEVWVVCL